MRDLGYGMALWVQHPAAVTLARWIVGITFLVAGATKLPNRERFLYVVVSYRVLPVRVATVYARALPRIEGMIGCLLIVGLAPRVAGSLAAMLLLSFTAAVGLNLVRGRSHLDCGCFGSRRVVAISRRILVRNCVLLALALEASSPYSYLALVTRPHLPHSIVSVMVASQSVVAAGIGAVILALLYPLLRETLSIWPQKQEGKEHA